MIFVIAHESLFHGERASGSRMHRLRVRVSVRALACDFGERVGAFVYACVCV